MYVCMIIPLNKQLHTVYGKAFKEKNPYSFHSFLVVQEKFSSIHTYAYVFFSAYMKMPTMKLFQ